jgi:hypothetical protein
MREHVPQDRLPFKFAAGAVAHFARSFERPAASGAKGFCKVPTQMQVVDGCGRSTRAISQKPEDCASAIALCSRFCGA